MHAEIHEFTFNTLIFPIFALSFFFKTHEDGGNDGNHEGYPGAEVELDDGQMAAAASAVAAVVAAALHVGDAESLEWESVPWIHPKVQKS